jgi:hypothetical protein
MYRILVRAAWIVAIAYSVVHVVVSGIIFPLSTPNVGQVVEELQPIYRQVLLGAATVDHPRQYGPVFLFVLDPVYRATIDRLPLLAFYCYALDVIAIGVALYAIVASLSLWLRERQMELSARMLLAIVVLWANFGPLYGVLAVKNVELWETALLAVACLALMKGARWTAGWCVAAAALTKMLPLVFFPYLLLRDRPTFVRATIALAAMLLAAQLVYGTDMGIGYLPNMIKAGVGASGYGNAVGLTWHENVSLRGLVTKAFGYLETPDPAHPNPLYSRGYYVIVPPAWRRASTFLGLAAQAVAIAWMGFMLARPRSWSRNTRLLWDFAFLGAMLLVIAPQASHDYMVLALGGFSVALVLCMVKRAPWLDFVAATLLVANVVPRGLFARLALIDPIMHFTGYTHLTRAEAYQYFGFPLLGLILLARCLSAANLDVTAHVARAGADV